MYLRIDKKMIEILEYQDKITLISLWDTTERAIEFYTEQKSLYTSYIINQNDIVFAHATPVKVFVFK